MNEVTITALPHPVTTFVLGIMIVSMAITVGFLLRTLSRMDNTEKKVEDLNNKIQNHQLQITHNISEVSRKVDSRIDKALGKVKKD